MLGNVATGDFRTRFSIANERLLLMIGRPGLVVMRGDSFERGRGFESQHWILDVHFSHLL